MKKFYTILVCLLFFNQFIYPQKSEKIEIPDSTKNIKKTLNAGLLNYRNGDYSLALTYLEQVKNQYSENIEIVYTLAECYYFTDKYSLAVKYFENAKSLNYKDNALLETYLADSYHKNSQFDEAKNLYHKFLIAATNETDKKYFEMRIKQCENGKASSSKTTTLSFLNLGENINSLFSDYAYFQLKDTNLVIISSKRNNCIGNQINPYDGQYYEDIYFSKNNNNNYESSYNAGNKINSEDPNACIGVSKTGEKIYVYSSENQGDIYEMELKNQKWLKTKKLNFINTLSQETSISLTKDEKFIYFVSDRDGGAGEKDIFMISQKSDSTYFPAINLGLNINTIYNEESVYINNTNDTLYFSSEGHNSIGGYDIFRSVKNKSGDWQKAENMGYPYNSPSDDMYFFPSDTSSFLTTTRENNIGNSDIYVVYQQSEPKKEIVAEIKDTTTVKEIVVAKPNYDNLISYIESQKIEFEFDKYLILNNYKTTLDSISVILIAHTDFVLEVMGYTDNLGTDNYNKKLSENRAKTVSDYLINKGVDKNQITFIGNSSKEPLSTNDTNEGRNKNRRVQFNIK